MLTGTDRECTCSCNVRACLSVILYNLSLLNNVTVSLRIDEHMKSQGLSKDPAGW